jgi:hypothetical protein
LILRRESWQRRFLLTIRRHLVTKAKAAPKSGLCPATFGGNLSKALAEIDPFGQCRIIMPVAATVYRSAIGSYIKLNLDGAFFKDAAPVWCDSNPQTPFSRRPAVTMIIGDRYVGGSREARVVIGGSAMRGLVH